MPITKRPLCYGKPRGPRGPPLPKDFKSNAEEPGILKQILAKDFSSRVEIKNKFRPVSNYMDQVKLMRLNSHPPEVIEKFIARHEEYYRENPEDEDKLSKPKPKYPQYMEEVGTTFEEYVEWAKKNDWAEEQIEELYKAKERKEKSIEGRNKHLDEVFTRFSGKSSTSKPKPKPLRVRFKVKALTIDIGEEEGGEDAEDEAVSDSEL